MGAAVQLVVHSHVVKSHVVLLPILAVVALRLLILVVDVQANVASLSVANLDAAVPVY